MKTSLKEYAISGRVLQGSVLGLFSWNIIYGDLLKLALSRNLKLLEKADDAAAMILKDVNIINLDLLI